MPDIMSFFITNRLFSLGIYKYKKHNECILIIYRESENKSEPEEIELQLKECIYNNPFHIRLFIPSKI